VTVPRTAAVVVTYNSSRTIERALAALRRCHDAGAARTIVVDNASSDRTLSILQLHADWITVVKSPGNIGFGRGCNRGLEEVREPYVVFVNPDAELEPDACRVLEAFLDGNPRAAMAAPAIIEADGEVQHVGGLTTPLGVMLAASGLAGRPRGWRMASPGTSPFRTDWLCGALFMTRSEVLRSLGGFDPRFFLYFEETDLCRRVAKAGLELWAVPAAVARHVGGASAAQSGKARIGGCIAEHFFPSRFYYLRKHFGVVSAAAAEVGELSLFAARVLIRRVRGRDARELTARFGWPMFRPPPPLQ
jgi:GT2 family glycosyltransferase